MIVTKMRQPVHQSRDALCFTSPAGERGRGDKGTAGVHIQHLV